MKDTMFEEVKYYGEISGKVIAGREAPRGFSKLKHKKRIKKIVSQPLTLDDFKLMGKGAGDAAKAFLEGYKEAIGDK